MALGVARGEGDATAVGSSTAPLRYVAGLSKLGMMTFRRMHGYVSFGSGVSFGCVISPYSSRVKCRGLVAEALRSSGLLV